LLPLSLVWRRCHKRGPHMKRNETSQAHMSITPEYCTLIPWGDGLVLANISVVSPWVINQSFFHKREESPGVTGGLTFQDLKKPSYEDGRGGIYGGMQWWVKRGDTMYRAYVYMYARLIGVSHGLFHLAFLFYILSRSKSLSRCMIRACPELSHINSTTQRSHAMRCDVVCRMSCHVTCLSNPMYQL
jgi:hypothetical protein